MPSLLLPTSKTTWKPPRERIISNDQMETFRKKDTATSLADLNETTAADGFHFKKSNDHALFYNLVFDEETKFPKILESTKHAEEAVAQRSSVKKMSFDLRPATLLKKRLWGRCFSWNFVKLLRTPFYIEHLWWLLLTQEILTRKRTYFMIRCISWTSLKATY